MHPWSSFSSPFSVPALPLDTCGRDGCYGRWPPPAIASAFDVAPPTDLQAGHSRGRRIDPPRPRQISAIIEDFVWHVRRIESRAEVLMRRSVVTVVSFLLLGCGAVEENGPGLDDAKEDSVSGTAVGKG